jgi:hypothetical protein
MKTQTPLNDKPHKLRALVDQNEIILSKLKANNADLSPLLHTLATLHIELNTLMR